MIHAIGRRKTSGPCLPGSGNGDIKINNRDFEYFPVGPLQYIVTHAQSVVNAKENFDVTVNVMGGGIRRPKPSAWALPRAGEGE